MIGLCGANGTGKTTIAEEASKAIELPFVKSTTSVVFKRMNLDPSKKLDFVTRMKVQFEILDELERQWSSVPDGRFISDRTPIDLIGYTLVEMQQEPELTEEQTRIVETYIAKCIEVTNRRFSTIIFVYPGLNITEEREFKATNNRVFVEHLSRIMLGTLIESCVKAAHFYIPRHMTDQKQRVEAVKYVYEKSIKSMLDAIKGAKEQGYDNVLH